MSELEAVYDTLETFRVRLCTALGLAYEITNDEDILEAIEELMARSE